MHDYEQVFFHVCANVDPKRDVLLSEGPLDQLDHAAMLPCFGGKLGIDATHKLPEEGAREWPERIEMTPEVRDTVDRRWEEYGLEPRRLERANFPGIEAKGTSLTEARAPGEWRRL